MRTSHGATHRPIHNDGRRKCMRPTRGGRVNPRCGDCARGCAQPKRVSENICAATADSVPDLGSLVAPMLAHIVAPVVDAIDFRPSSNGYVDCARGRAQSKRVSESMCATAQTVQFAGPWVSGPMLAHMSARAVDATDFRASKRRRRAVSRLPRTHSRRECGRAMARRRGQFADRGSPVTPMLAHMSVRPILAFRHLRTATVDVNAIVTRVGAGPIC